MCRVLFSAVLISLLSFGTFNAATINIPTDYPTIQQGINAAVNGDTVLVAPGTYVENLDFKGKAITVTSSSGASETIIDGGNPANPDHGSVVRFQSREGLDSVLDGFTLTKGSGTRNGYDTYGGGVNCFSSSPTIANNIITNNSTGDWGGGAGISCRNATPTIVNNVITENSTGKWGCGGGIGCWEDFSPIITNNTISGNSAFRGGGIYSNYYASPVITKNTISKNMSYQYGPGIFCEDRSDPIIIENTISGNAGSGIGTDIKCSPFIAKNIISGNKGNGIGCGFECQPTITGNIIIGNSTIYKGGGIRCHYSKPTIINNTLINNFANEGGGGIAVTEGSVAIVSNTVLWNNSAPSGTEIWVGPGNGGWISTLTISYSDVEGGKTSIYVEQGHTLNWGAGMIDSDPFFVDKTNNDLHFSYPSPCRDSGDNSVVTELSDFEGDPRIADSTVDMGADEFYTHLYYTGDATPGGSVELKFIDLPGTSPVGFWIAFNALDTPISGAYGDWWLLPPMVGPFSLPPIPSNGVYVLSGNIPASPPGPYTLYLQAIMGTPLKLSNLCVMEVE